MKPLTRRSVTTGLAAAVTAIPAAAFSVELAKVTRGPGELAALIRRYWSEVDVFNADPAMEADDKYFAEQPYDVTMEEMVGVPARSAEDALAAVDWIIREGADSMIELGGGNLWGRVSESLVNAVRGYLEGRAS